MTVPSCSGVYSERTAFSPPEAIIASNPKRAISMQAPWAAILSSCLPWTTSRYVYTATSRRNTICTYIKIRNTLMKDGIRLATPMMSSTASTMLAMHGEISRSVATRERAGRATFTMISRTSAMFAMAAR
uniref:(northern house mosquito) hypothetical protein n=1 Tax=Culex pipiens TaxID=7175 RepID=A0A8D8BPS9_CULPI